MVSSEGTGTLCHAVACISASSSPGCSWVISFRGGQSSTSAAKTGRVSRAARNSQRIQGGKARPISDENGQVRGAERPDLSLVPHARKYRTGMPAFAAASAQWVAPREPSFIQARHTSAPSATISALRRNPATLP